MIKWLRIPIISFPYNILLTFTYKIPSDLLSKVPLLFSYFLVSFIFRVLFIFIKLKQTKEMNVMNELNEENVPCHLINYKTKK